MRRRLTPGLALLRATGFSALLLLLWNPITTRHLPGGRAERPLVLLDGSLSLAGRGGRWREALDSARALAGGGVIWRFGTQVAGFDSAPPGDGASRLAPALTAAAARGGPVAVVTDGELEDVAGLAPDLLRLPQVVVLRRAPFRDAFVASVEGTERVTASDTVRLRVSYGTAGRRDARCGMGDAGCGRRHATLVVVWEGRHLASQAVALPDSGIVSTDLSLPASRIPHPGWSALEVRLEGAADSEPRDDARLFPIEVTSLPSVVVLAAPPNWDLRFLARTLVDVARVPVKTFVAPETGRARWRDAATLAPVSTAEVRRALGAARLVVLGGEPAALGGLTGGGAALRWPGTTGQEGDWYVDPPPPSPLSAALAGVAWDSLPPAAAAGPMSRDSGSIVALTARLARRGSARPVLLLSERGGVRRAELAATGLYRWAFRGGASTEAYRALIGALAEWLLGGDGGRGTRDEAVPEARVVANGLPIVWRWVGAGAAHDVGVTLTAAGSQRRDTLRFDAQGRSELRLPPGVYRYALAGGPEQGMVAVETYSDEWRPAAPTLVAHAGAPASALETVSARDRWWLFALAIAAFAAEWAWRRRQGLP